VFAAATATATATVSPLLVSFPFVVIIDCTFNMLPHQKHFALGATAVVALHAIVLGLHFAVKKRKEESEYVDSYNVV
jgi:hypothetical protein